MDWNKIGDWILELARTSGLRLLSAIIVLILGSLLIKLVLKIFPDGQRHSSLDPTAKSFLRSFINIGLWIILLVCAIAILGVPMASIVAVIASAGLAIGLALQGSLSNLAGGIMILLFRPFNIGEFIEAGSNSGVVDDLGIFYTVLVTLDNKHITIPNGTLMNNAITNYSREKNRRVDIDFSISYDADGDRACALALAVASSHPKALADPAPFCRVTSLGQSDCTVTLRVWAEAGDYWEVKHDLISSVRHAFTDNGIEIPYPQLDLHIRDICRGSETTSDGDETK